MAIFVVGQRVLTEHYLGEWTGRRATIIQVYSDMCRLRADTPFGNSNFEQDFSNDYLIPLYETPFEVSLHEYISKELGA